MPEKCKQPYTFVPVVTDNIKTHEVTFHDGKASCGKLTGVMHCTLTVKTPMLVGHYQYKAETIKGLKQNVIIQRVENIINATSKHVALPENWGACGYKQENNGTTNHVVHKDKSILEPLFLNGKDSSPVLIAGTSIKGMVRQSLGAITNAPMERVAEKQFSYRPGIVFQAQRGGSEFKILKATAGGTIKYEQQNGLYVRTGKEKTLKITLNDTKEKITLDEEMVKIYCQSYETYNKKETSPDIPQGSTIFVEYCEDKVLSFGNHEQYRWIYSSTTTQHHDDYNFILRKQLSRHDDEKVNATYSKLTAVRSLMGYVDGGDKGNNEDLNLGIGDGKDYARLAGRISINTAVEVIDKTKNLSDRFELLNGMHSISIPLKILAAPKASAVECYIDQSDMDADDNELNTYGDFPGFISKEGDLAGRKFYRRVKTADYALSQTDDVELAGKQSSIARYISKPDTTFKFSVRFKDLSEAELGALICALSPNLAENKDAAYWQQLGHGRPLGMGNVDIKIDAINILTNELGWDELLAKKETYITAFKDSALYDKGRYVDWLEICTPQNKPTPYMGTDKHSNLRKAHIKAVRGIA